MKIENLDHLGLVAGIIDELGLVELTNEQIGEHCLEQVSVGNVLKAMLLNCLGFVSAPLYLFSEFFESKPTEHLLGEGIEARHLNDDRLGRVLDKLYELGSSTFFLRVALQAVARFGIEVKQLHLDSTSMSVEGEYDTQNQEEQGEGKDSTNGEEPNVIRICRGYSRDQRPDLKQFLINLICSADGGVPLWLKIVSGNENDSRQFAEIMTDFANNWQTDSLFVIDAAFYSENNLKSVESLLWLSRAPQTLRWVKELVQGSTDGLVAVDSDVPDYQMWETTQDYGGIPQRWILIESQTRKADASLWEPELKRLEGRLQRELKQLQQQIFACKPDAMEALLRFEEKLDVHQFKSVRVESIRTQKRPGRPCQSDSDSIQGYQIKAELERKITTAEQFQRQKSRFVLATNQLDAVEWPASRLLAEYKGQQKVERGFRFLKDPLFFTSSVFVKKPQRVEALALVMALTLMVYTLAERKLRRTLAQQQETVLDQRKQPTVKPTFRWITQKFQGIHWVTIDHHHQVSNLTDERHKIVRLLGSQVERYYSSS